MPTDQRRDPAAPSPDGGGGGGGRRGDSSPPSPGRGRLTEDAAVFGDFVRIVQSKFSSGSVDVGRLDDLYRSPEYGAEKAMLTEMNNNGMWWGLGVGIGTFAIMRRGLAALARYMVKRRGGSVVPPPPNVPGSGGYKFDSPFERAAGGADDRSPRRPGLLFRAVKLGLDLFVSFGFAAYASAIGTDKKRLLKEMSEIPLVEGRSLLSDELCGDFTRQYRSVPAETWDRYRGKSRALDAIEGFVLNCRRRELFEERLRAERGLSPGGTSGHALVPPPGVPGEIVATIEDVRASAHSDAEGGGEEGGGARRRDGGDFGEDDFDGGGDASGQWTSIDDFGKEEVGQEGEGEGGSRRPRWGF